MLGRTVPALGLKFKTQNFSPINLVDLVDLVDPSHRVKYPLLSTHLTIPTLRSSSRAISRAKIIQIEESDNV